MTQAGYHFCVTCGGKFYNGHARETYDPDRHRYKVVWQCWPCERETQRCLEVGPVRRRERPNHLSDGARCRAVSSQPA